jgi:NADH-quinone oxidoreductase subunit J
MGLYDILFFYFAAVAVLTALLAISRPNPVHAVLFLVPAGALMVLYLFVVFLFNLSEVRQIRAAHRQSALAGIVAVTMFILMAVLSVQSIFPGPFMATIQSMGADNTAAVGGSLYTEFLFPFELASLVLLVVMFGAMVLARREDKE